ARGPARFRSGRIAGCAWLSAAQLSLADHKPANGLYGGSFANRMRYPLEVAAALREVWPRRKALGMRITGTDWLDGGITPDEAGIFAAKLRDIGIDLRLRLVRRHQSDGAARHRAGLPGAARRRRQKGRRHYRAGGRHDRRRTRRKQSSPTATPIASRWRAAFSTILTGSGM